MIDAPVNDVACLSKLEARAKEHSTSQLAKYYAKLYGTIDALVAAIRAKPQLNDTGEIQGEQIACDTLQHVDFWVAKPNCFERTADFLAVANLIDPSQRYSLMTMDVTGGRHTLPLVWLGGKWEPIDLSPAPARRNASTSTQDGEEVLAVGDSVGQVALDAFGLNSVGTWVHGQWVRLGYLPPAKTPAAPAGATPAAALPSAPAKSPAAAQGAASPPAATSGSSGATTSPQQGDNQAGDDYSDDEDDGEGDGDDDEE